MSEETVPQDSFAYLSSSIIRSTIWDESSDVRVLWITMMALKDKDGCVWASIPGLAHEARVSISVVQEGLKLFMSPDEFSRTEAEEGRRIKEIDGGWRFVNHAKYRRSRDPEKRRQQTKEATQRWRARKALSEPIVSQGEPVSSKVSPSVSISRSVSSTSESSIPRTTPSRKMAGPAGDVCRAFNVGHRELLRVPYLCAFARDQKALKEPLRVYGLPLVLEMVAAFWTERRHAQTHPDNPMYAAGRAKPHIPGFIGQIPNLLSRYEFDATPPSGDDHATRQEGEL